GELRPFPVDLVAGDDSGRGSAVAHGIAGLGATGRRAGVAGLAPDADVRGEGDRLARRPRTTVAVSAVQRHVVGVPEAVRRVTGGELRRLSVDVERVRARGRAVVEVVA